MWSGVTYVHTGEAILTVERLHVLSPQKGLCPLVIFLRLPHSNRRSALSLQMALRVLEFDINGFAQSILFLVWLFSLNIIVVRCVRVVCGFYFWVAFSGMDPRQLAYPFACDKPTSFFRCDYLLKYGRHTEKGSDHT